MSKKQPKIRVFKTGANRNPSDDKLDFEGFLSPFVIQRFAEYMHLHRKLSDGTLRTSDNWKKGMPKREYMKSGFRHFHDWWIEELGGKSRDGVEDAICGLMFNCMGYLEEVLKEKSKKR